MKSLDTKKMPALSAHTHTHTLSWWSHDRCVHHQFTNYPPVISDLSHPPRLLHSSSSRPSSYHGLRAGPFPREEVPEIRRRRLFALLLRRLPHPDAALRGAAEAGAAAAAAAAATAQGEAQRGAQGGPALGGVRLRTLKSGGQRGLRQAEQVVMGVELTHVADGFTRRDVTWFDETKKCEHLHTFDFEVKHVEEVQENTGMAVEIIWYFKVKTWIYFFLKEICYLKKKTKKPTADNKITQLKAFTPPLLLPVFHR